MKEVLVCRTTVGTTACRPQERNAAIDVGSTVSLTSRRKRKSPCTATSERHSSNISRQRCIAMVGMVSLEEVDSMARDLDRGHSPSENRGYPFELSCYIKTYYDAKRGVTSRVLKSALRCISTRQNESPSCLMLLVLQLYAAMYLR